MVLLGKKFDRKKKFELRRVKRSVINSINGLVSSYHEEQSLLIHFVMSLVVIFCGIFFKINRYDWIFSIILMGLILCIELLNTAIEANVDLVTQNIHPLAKRAKDVGSSATFMMSIFAFIGEVIIFYPYFINYFAK